MGGNLIGRLAWVVLGLIGLFTTVDLGFGPIVICPQCGPSFNMIVGVILIALSVGAFVMDRRAAPRG
jgi:hypothetical protein